jgi:IS30 family transposase
MGWSSEQIAGRLRRQAAQHEISHESIYRWIYGPIGRRERLHRYLARAKARRGRRPRAGRREPAIPNRTPIHWRPAKASCRTEFGHWEADLMHFRRQRDALLTLQERKTRITLGGRLASKRAEPTMDQIVAKLAALPKRARRSATFDNGGEWARHEYLRAELGMRTYFCDPHSPWQRGGIENANGVLRRDVPRHATLSGYCDHDLDALLWAFNTTPRKCLAFETPGASVARYRRMIHAGAMRKCRRQRAMRHRRCRTVAALWSCGRILELREQLVDCDRPAAPALLSLNAA